MDIVTKIASRAKAAAPGIAAVDTETKNRVLEGIANAIVSNSQVVIDENKKDVKRCSGEGISESLLDRLMLVRPLLHNSLKNLQYFFLCLLHLRHKELSNFEIF